MIAEISNKGEN